MPRIAGDKGEFFDRALHFITCRHVRGEDGPLKVFPPEEDISGRSFTDITPFKNCVLYLGQVLGRNTWDNPSPIGGNLGIGSFFHGSTLDRHLFQGLLKLPLVFIQGIFGGLSIPVRDGQLASSENDRPLRLIPSDSHFAQLSTCYSCVDSSSNESESGSDSRHPLRSKMTVLAGIVLGSLCWFFVYFRFDPKRWWWQYPLCVFLLMISFALIAEGVYALS